MKSLILRSVFFVFLLFTILSACMISCVPYFSNRDDLSSDPEDLEIIGKWTHQAGSPVLALRTVIEVTKNLFTIEDGLGNVKCSAGIVRFDNDKFNGGELDKKSDHGFVMVKFVSGMLSYLPKSAVGKYGIVRWKNLSNDKNSVDFFIAYKDSLMASYTDNAEVAYSDFTHENGYFNALLKYRFLRCEKN